MEGESRDLLDIWIANWSDIVDFEVHDVISSAEAAAAAAATSKPSASTWIYTEKLLGTHSIFSDTQNGVASINQQILLLSCSYLVK